MRSRFAVGLAIGLLRIAVGVFTISVLLFTFGLNVASGEANPFDYFGYFTNQTSLLMGVVLIASGVITLVRGAASPGWLTLLRGAATAYLLVVAVIYNLLVPGTGSAPPWVSAVLHIIVPTFAALDWLLVGDRAPLRWSRLWILLPYPTIWLAVVLVRGVTDGWVPYGFLLPDNGTISLTLHVIALICAVMIAGVIVWSTSRLHLPPLGRTSAGDLGRREATDSLP